MKFETKNKPELYGSSYSDGGASFEWLIDKQNKKKPIPIKLVSNEMIPIAAPAKHKNPPISSKSVTMNSIIGTIPDKNVLEK